MKKAKKKSVAGAVNRRIIEIITGPGVAKRIAENAKRPKIFSRNDGVVFDPRLTGRRRNPRPFAIRTNPTSKQQF